MMMNTGDMLLPVNGLPGGCEQSEITWADYLDQMVAISEMVIVFDRTVYFYYDPTRRLESCKEHQVALNQYPPTPLYMCLLHVLTLSHDCNILCCENCFKIHQMFNIQTGEMHVTEFAIM